MDFQYLIEQSYLKLSTKEHRKTYAQFFTPPAIASLMAAYILDNTECVKILDPANGLTIFGRALDEHLKLINHRSFDGQYQIANTLSYSSWNLMNKGPALSFSQPETKHSTLSSLFYNYDELSHHLTLSQLPLELCLTLSQNKAKGVKSLGAIKICCAEKDSYAQDKASADTISGATKAEIKAINLHSKPVLQHPHLSALSETNQEQSIPSSTKQDLSEVSCFNTPLEWFTFSNRFAPCATNSKDTLFTTTKRNHTALSQEDSVLQEDALSHKSLNNADIEKLACPIASKSLNGASQNDERLQSLKVEKEQGQQSKEALTEAKTDEKELLNTHAHNLEAINQVYECNDTLDNDEDEDDLLFVSQYEQASKLRGKSPSGYHQDQNQLEPALHGTECREINAYTLILKQQYMAPEALTVTKVEPIDLRSLSQRQCTPLQTASKSQSLVSKKADATFKASSNNPATSSEDSSNLSQNKEGAGDDYAATHTCFTTSYTNQGSDFNEAHGLSYEHHAQQHSTNIEYTSRHKNQPAMPSERHATYDQCTIKMVEPADSEVLCISTSPSVPERHVRLVTYEIDPIIAEFASLSAIQMPMAYVDIKFRLKDYLKSNFKDRYDGIICNPPYKTFKEFARKSQSITLIEERLGLKLSGRTNLYALFLLKSLYQLKPNGRCAYLIPYEFLNSSFGIKIKEQLIKQRNLAYVINFDLDAPIFDNATTTCGLFLFDNAHEHSHVEFITLHSVEEIEQLMVRICPNLISSYPETHQSFKRYVSRLLTPKEQEQTDSKVKEESLLDSLMQGQSQAKLSDDLKQALALTPSLINALPSSMLNTLLKQARKLKSETNKQASADKLQQSIETIKDGTDGATIATMDGSIEGTIETSTKVTTDDTSAEEFDALTLTQSAIELKKDSPEGQDTSLDISARTTHSSSKTTKANSKGLQTNGVAGSNSMVEIASHTAKGDSHNAKGDSNATKATKAERDATDTIGSSSNTLEAAKEASLSADNSMQSKLSHISANKSCQGRIVPYSQLKAKQKWHIYYQERTTPFTQPDTQLSNNKPLTTFDQFIKVKRGLATGANEFFLFNKSKVEETKIPFEYFIRVIPRANFIQRSIFTGQDLQELEKQDAPVYLLNAPAQVEDPNLKKYLAQGEAQEIHLRYLTRHRCPWYALERRQVAPILVSVFNRGSMQVVRNEAGIFNLTAFHSIFVLQESKTDLIFAYLLTNLAKDIILQNRREYGGGLEKLEPLDINHAACIDFNQLSAKEEAEILELYRAYRERVLSKGAGNSKEATHLLDAISKQFQAMS